MSPSHPRTRPRCTSSACAHAGILAAHAGIRPPAGLRECCCSTKTGGRSPQARMRQLLSNVFILPQEEDTDMSRLWRQNKERNRRVRQAREQLVIVHESILALHAALKSDDKEPQQLLALTTRLDA